MVLVGILGTVLVWSYDGPSRNDIYANYADELACNLYINTIT